VRSDWTCEPHEVPLPKAAKRSEKKSASATVGYEAELWQMADALRGSMDAAEYKHVVLGLIFLKYISDAFEEHRAKLQAQPAARAGESTVKGISVIRRRHGLRWCRYRGADDTALPVGLGVIT
jgi:type I restriction-modification system DNA methylase subunit